MKAFSKKEILEGNHKEIIIYGTGVLGEIALAGMRLLGMEPNLFCDHDPNETSYKGFSVLSPNQLKQHQSAVIVVAFKDFLQQALHNLRNAGCKNIYHILPLLELDYQCVDLSSRAKEMLVRKSGYITTVMAALSPDAISTQHIEIMATERCTLNCRDCSALIPYFQKPNDIELSSYWSAFDKLFEVFDYIGEVSLLGGETFLNGGLWKFIKRYVDYDRIGMMAVYTNGTVIPNEKTICALKHPKVWVHISNYGNVSNRIGELEKLFTQHGIQYFVRSYDVWQSSGGFRLRTETENQLVDKVKTCFKSNCFSFYRGKLYRCSRASSAIEAGILEPSAESFIDFCNNSTIENLKERTVDFLNKKYSTMCKFCDGFQINGPGVEPAIQHKGRRSPNDE